MTIRITIRKKLPSSTLQMNNIVVVNLLRNMGNRKMSVIILLDMSKAFDRVHHDILLLKLQAVTGVFNDAILWFESYLLHPY